MSHATIRSLAKSSTRSQLYTPAAFFQQCRAKSATASSPSRNFAARNTNDNHTRARLETMSRSRLVSSKIGGHRQSFSSTAPSLATIVKQNPRADDEGNDMTIEISERAAKRLRQITSSPQKPNSLTNAPSTPDSHLRVTVTSGGCHGFQYLMSLEGAAKIDQEEDTIFGSGEDGGEGHAEVVMDSASLELLKGSTIDYTTELIGSQFKIVGNPRAKSSCGCGTSFDIE